MDSKVTDNLDAENMENVNRSPGDTSNIDQELNQETNDFQQTGDLESTWFEIPNSYVLSQNYPNPFNSATTINYQLPEDVHVLIKIYNARGEEIRTLVDEYKTASYYSVQWNGRDNYGNEVSSGIYLYRIFAGNHVYTRKMVFVE
jgi:flagellar hook assembly protein FlgD